jgi:small ubiquitin-related modifier
MTAPVSAAVAVSSTSAAAAGEQQQQLNNKTTEKESEKESTTTSTDSGMVPPHPAKNEHPDQINLKVKAQDGNEIYFKVKKTTQFRKVFIAFARKVGADVDSVRFLFDGQRIRPEQTPNDLGMEHDDEIDAMVSQTGGGGDDGTYNRARCIRCCQ